MRTVLAATAAIALAGAAAGASAQTAAWLNNFAFHDLSHPVPTFQPKDGDHTKADLTKPWKNSVPTAGFGFQAVRILKSPFKTERGFFQWAWLYLDEHYGTHVDSTDHYQNAPGTLNVPKHDDRSTEQFGDKDLVGPIIFIDISARVDAELKKNGGKPSPDPKVTNFGDGGPATVTVADIARVERQFVNGAWLVIRTGWDKFFFGAPPENPFMHPYANGFNYPGLGEAAVKKIIEIENKRKVRLAGIMMDQLSIDSGNSGMGPTNNPNGRGWFAHHEGLQRGWKFIENGTNLGALARYAPGQCALVLGSIKIIGGSGAPARVIGMCRRG